MRNILYNSFYQIQKNLSGPIRTIFKLYRKKEEM